VMKDLDYLLPLGDMRLLLLLSLIIGLH